MAEMGTQFADNLGRAHAMLTHDLAKLEDAAHPESRHGLAELHERLREARLHVAEHFGMEEKGGYMDAALKREPRLEHAAAVLGAEHGALLAALDGLLASAERGNDVGGVREQVRLWMHRLREHERHEIDLTQEAFGRDISAED